MNNSSNPEITIHTKGQAPVKTTLKAIQGAADILGKKGSKSKARSDDFQIQMPGTEHNQMNPQTAQQLKTIVERVEQLEEEKKALSADIKEVYDEAKGNGFDVKIIRKVVAIRKQETSDRVEQEQLIDLYLDAVGSKD